MEYYITEDPFTGMYTAWLQSSSTPNCEGTGTTPEEAVAVLKITKRIREKNNV